jgi:hypothetical protein
MTLLNREDNKREDNKMDYLDKHEEKLETSEQEEVNRTENRIRLHDGLNGNLTELLNSSCGDCNRQLEWEASYHSINKSIPISFIAKHCRRIYSISGFQTGVRVTTVTDEEARDQVDNQKSKRYEAKTKKESEEKQQKDKELADKQAEESQNKKDLAEIQKQGLNIDKEGGQADVLNAQKDAQTVATHAEDPKTRRQAGTIADRLDQQTEVNK